MTNVPIVAGEMNGLVMRRRRGLQADVESYDISNTRKNFECRLAAYIRDVWERNKRAKLDVEQRMLKSLRQRNGEYDPQKLALIRLTEGSEIFSMLTYIKCKAAE